MQSTNLIVFGRRGDAECAVQYMIQRDSDVVERYPDWKIAIYHVSVRQFKAAASDSSQFYHPSSSTLRLSFNDYRLSGPSLLVISWLKVHHRKVVLLNVLRNMSIVLDLRIQSRSACLIRACAQMQVSLRQPQLVNTVAQRCNSWIQLLETVESSYKEDFVVGSGWSVRSLVCWYGSIVSVLP